MSDFNLKQDDIIEFSAEKLVNSGSAIARYEGKAVFIEGAVPGDTVKVRITRINKNFMRAKIIEIIKPSPHRIKPFCPLFNACGGCSLQNIEYNFLIEQKQKILEEIFSPDNLYAFSGIYFKPFIRAEKLQNYRCKVQNAVSETKVSKRLLIGYYKENTHDTVNIKYCPIQPKIIDEIVNYIRENWKFGAYVEKKDKGLLKHLVIRYSSTSEKLMLTFVINKDFEFFNKIKPELERFSDALIEKFPVISGVLVNFNPKKTNKITGDRTELLFGEPFIHQKLYSNNGIEYTYKVSAESFFQINPHVAQKVFDSVKSLIEPNSTILDAYGGVAAIGIFLSDKAKSLTLVEESESSVNDAKENFKLNNCKNYEVFLGDAKEIFKSFLKSSVASDAKKDCAVQKNKGKNQSKTFDYTILDPPRKGSDKEALEIISKLTKKAVIYVSCNPSTLARDAKILHENRFKLKSLQGADMFPFTHHIESIAYFEKE